MPPFRDLTGQQFNKWAALSRADRGPRAWWTCRCVCGHVGTIRGSHLTSALSKGCDGCAKESMRKRPNKAAVVRFRNLGTPVWVIARRLGMHQQTLRRYMGWSMAEPQRTSAWMRKHREKIEEARLLGYMWVQILHGLQAPYICPRSMQTAWASFRGTEMRRALNCWIPKKIDVMTAKVQAMTAEGLSAEEIADRLGVSSRTVVRLRKHQINPLPVANIDLGRVTKLLQRGVQFGSINQRLGKPFQTPNELEAVYNFLMDQKMMEAA